MAYCPADSCTICPLAFLFNNEEGKNRAVCLGHENMKGSNTQMLFTCALFCYNLLMLIELLKITLFMGAAIMGAVMLDENCIVWCPTWHS